MKIIKSLPEQLSLGSDFFCRMINRFLEYITVEKRYAPNTVKSYAKDLEDFLHFYRDTEGAEEISKAGKKSLRNFIVHLSSNGISKRSISRKLSTLRSFYLFLLRIGEIEVSPAQEIAPIKFYPEKQIPFSEQEMEEVKEIFQKQPEDGLKELIVEMLYQTGMRKAELCNLLIENVSFTESHIKVTGKGNKQRLIPVSPELILRLEKYSQHRKPLKDNEMFFFLSKKGKKLNEKFVYSTVNSYLSMVTSKKKKSPHILRHSFATHVLEHGAEISKVKALMGHSSLASTQVYTSANISQLKKVYNLAHPRAGKNNEEKP